MKKLIKMIKISIAMISSSRLLSNRDARVHHVTSCERITASDAFYDGVIRPFDMAVDPRFVTHVLACQKKIINKSKKKMTKLKTISSTKLWQQEKTVVSNDLKKNIFKKSKNWHVRRRTSGPILHVFVFLQFLTKQRRRKKKKQQ
jgi:hypothetical protein